MTAAELRPLVLKLPVDEQKILLHQLQDAIAAEEGFELVPLDKRQSVEAAPPADFRRRNPEDGYTWGEVMNIIELRRAKSS